MEERERMSGSGPTARPPPVHRILTFGFAPPSLAYFCSSRPSTARPDPDIRSRSSIFSLLPCYFCSRPSTARPPDPDILSRSSRSSLLPCYFCSSARPQPVHRIRTFSLAPPSLASSHAISAAPARPQPVHRPPDPDIRFRSSVSSLFLQLPPVHSPSTARPDPDIRSRSSIFSLLPCYFCSRPSTARPPPVHRIRTFSLAPPVIS